MNDHHLSQIAFWIVFIAIFLSLYATLGFYKYPGVDHEVFIKVNNQVRK